MMNKRAILAVLICGSILGCLLGFALSYEVLNPQIQNLQLRLQLAEREFSSAVSSLNATINTLQRDLTDTKRDLANAKKDLADARAEVLLLNTTFRQEIAQIQGRLKELTQMQSELSKELTNTKMDLDRVNRTLQDLDGYVESVKLNLQQEISKVKEDVNNLNVRLSELEKRLNFTEFKTLTELRDWLRWDNTSAYKYVEDIFDCDDFAFTLMCHAFASGYKMGTVVVYYVDTLWYIYYKEAYWWKVPLNRASYPPYWVFGNHMANIVYVRESGWVLVEPQTDAVYVLGIREL